MAWTASWTTFTTAVTNTLANLQAALVNHKACLDVLQTVYADIHPVLMEPGTPGGTYTAAVLYTGFNGNIGQLTEGPFLNFRGTKLGGFRDAAVFSVKIPADAAANTAATIDIYGRMAGAAAGGNCKIFVYSSKFAVGDTVDGTPQAATTTNTETFADDATHANKLFTYSETLDLVSAGDILHGIIYRNADDAADTSTHDFCLNRVGIRYTRTI